jgi:hypothetical protein
MKTIILPVTTIIILLLASCSANPEEAIVNRWKITDVKGNNRERFLNKNKDESSEMEFTADGKCFIYENGSLKASIPYVMAPDGKSLLLTDPSGRESMPVNILHLTSDRLEINSRMYGMRDTIIFTAE